MQELLDNLKDKMARLEELRARGMDLPDPEALHRAHVDVTLAIAAVALEALAQPPSFAPPAGDVDAPPTVMTFVEGDPPIVDAIIERSEPEHVIEGNGDGKLYDIATDRRIDPDAARKLEDAPGC